ncbi:PREDICTED: ejaculatory bulb-specific protein 3-like [Cyphomyrmex costatus]|uniref:Ejaculatory bulb-specific protein 3 n=1 Tax=Cyphomyrmex costatus TaxID=456900 RepID=A0A151IQS1_9HYME|nr:PREDICTED: ejaculatory bulb-specific protein 3-like [Cyphomyrmex costatus]KYN08563.1 Ejaculatory bulb-specific protein 3 [Cyphomyrmex costatus]
MKLAVFCLLAIISIVYADQYTNKFDNIDVDQIISNDRLLKRYVDCVLDKPNVRCPAEAQELKKHINEALENECEKCTERQKEMIKKVIKHIVNNKQDMWNELKAKFDPEEKYAKKYEDEAKN